MPTFNLPVEQVETASQIIHNLNDAATGPLFVAEEKGFREGDGSEAGQRNGTLELSTWVKITSA